MKFCRICNREALISSILPICAVCIRKEFDSAYPYIQKAHTKVRLQFRLPEAPPKDFEGKSCGFCVNLCRLKESKVGFCNLPLDSREEASLSWNYDALPTNCVADWVCPGSTDYGNKNLAVFYNACSFDCLFCQNWHFKEMDLNKKMTPQDLAEKVDERTTCICYFGGDPTPQLPHSILASRKALESKKKRVLRICWETNGSMSLKFLKEIVEITLESGGCIKFDLKSWTENLNIALCGITNRQTLENFRFVAGFINKRPNPPLLIASTLLIPGYIDIYEVEKITSFIAKINPEIPYSLLAFHPQFLMDDLPTTSHSHAQQAKVAALKAGLKNVRIANSHLLSNAY